MTRTKASFTWMREAKTYDSWSGRRNPDIKCSITLSIDKLFNVSAYTPGDYLRFANNARTREQYLKWGPILLAAEEYYAQKKRNS